MNRDFAYANATDNQLRAWNHVDLFDTDIGDAGQYQAFVAPDDTSATLQTRARTYLAVNCAQCHRPGTDVTLSLDLRFDTANADMRAIGQVPQAGDLGITDARIIAPGDRQRSVLWRRMEAGGHDNLKDIGYLMINVNPSSGSPIPRQASVIFSRCRSNWAEGRSFRLI